MTNTLLTFTFTFISVLAILMIPMGRLRRDKVGTLRGDGGDPELFKRIRIHGNLMENAPLLALVMGAAEYSGLATGWLWLAVATFVAGRIAHYALFDSTKRGLAMFVTVLPSVVMGLWLLVQIWL
jgi:uncharacterized membrane protein YecN with MAPEG domain